MKLSIEINSLGKCIFRNNLFDDIDFMPFKIGDRVNCIKSYHYLRGQMTLQVLNVFYSIFFV